MPCESCAVQFSVFRRKRACCECERYYCSGCLRRGGGNMCASCRVLSTRPLSRNTIAHLKVRDLQCFLQRQNVSTRGCVEKEELVSLCVSHVNSASYRRRGARGSNPFISLKGLTNNLNEFLNSAFDLRQPQPQPPPPPPTARNCYNSAHTHATSPGNNVPTAPPQPYRERFTTTPSGEHDITVPVPVPVAVSRSASGDSARVDTADCYEIEDLDDAGWELVNTPADPLPNDSDVLLSTTESSCARRERDPDAAACSRPIRDSPPASPPAAPLVAPLAAPPVQRAASELELRRAESAAELDSVSLQDEPLGASDDGTPRHISLEQFDSAAQLAQLNVKQLKELLTRNRVEFRGCLERAELLARAQTLWRNHNDFKDDLDNLPIEECCKICMAAPLECVLLECGHIAACTRCAKQLAECPICRQYVVRAVRFFRS